MKADQQTVVLERYKYISFKTLAIEGEGVLEVFTIGKQNGQEYVHNISALRLLAEQGGQYRLLPVIEDGHKNPDAFNLLTGNFVDVKVPRSHKGKNIIQSALKEASTQGVSELVLHLLQKPDSYRNMYIALKNTLQNRRATRIKIITVIYPDNTLKTYNINKLRAKLNNKGAN